MVRTVLFATLTFATAKSDLTFVPSSISIKVWRYSNSFGGIAIILLSYSVLFVRSYFDNKYI